MAIHFMNEIPLTQAGGPEENGKMEQKKKKKAPPGPLMEMLPGGVSSLRGTHHGTTIEYPSTPRTPGTIMRLQRESNI